MASKGLGPPQPPGPRRSSVASQKPQPGLRLGAIDEDGGMRPDQPVSQALSSSPTAHSWSLSKNFPFEISPLSHEREPPPYSEWDGSKGPGGQSFAALRRGKKSTRRKGWTWIVVFLIVGSLIVTGLVVGLVVGLRKRNSGDSSSTSPLPSEETDRFPAGSYSFVTFLKDVQTDCTSNPATWQCYPYQTINQTETGAMATFNWIIRPLSPDSSTYVISSTQNPFSISFANKSLSLTNSGRDDEAYTFSISLDKVVAPTAALTSDGSATRCMYNATTLTASLYTKKARTYLSQGMSSEPNRESFKPWPQAVSISQSIAGGASVPDCYKLQDGKMGERITLPAVPPLAQCSCNWQDYGN